MCVCACYIHICAHFRNVLTSVCVCVGVVLVKEVCVCYICICAHIRNVLTSVCVCVCVCVCVHMHACVCVGHRRIEGE